MIKQIKQNGFLLVDSVIGCIIFISIVTLFSTLFHQLFRTHLRVQHIRDTSHYATHTFESLLSLLSMTDQDHFIQENYEKLSKPIIRNLDDSLDYDATPIVSRDLISQDLVRYSYVISPNYTLELLLPY